MNTVYRPEKTPERMSHAPAVRAFSYGPEVELARGSGYGAVLSATRSCAYMRSEAGHVFGVVGAEAANGPLGLRVADISPLLGVSDSAPFEFCGECLLVGGRKIVDLREATIWSPQTPQTQGGVSSRQAAAREFLDLLVECGCGPTSRTLSGVRQAGSVEGRVERAIGCRVEGLAEALASQDVEATFVALVGLLGLGPGLTPAGDDLVAGVVAAAAWRSDHSDFAAALQERAKGELEAAATCRTGAVSARLLHHAALGSLYAPAMRLGARLLAGDTEAVRESAPALLEIGGSSGSETAAGILLGMTIFEDSEGKRFSWEIRELLKSRELIELAGDAGG